MSGNINRAALSLVQYTSIKLRKDLNVSEEQKYKINLKRNIIYIYISYI